VETLDARSASRGASKGRISVEPTNDRVIPESDLRNRRQDWVRAAIAGSFILMLLIVIIFACSAAVSWPTHWDQTKELLQIILSPLTGLLGSAVGFYFGARDSGARVRNHDDGQGDVV
jgi:hypothetical protein